MKKEESATRLYSSLPLSGEYKTWAEIDTSAIKHNYNTLSSDIGDGVRRICVIKADAYGHGADQFALTLVGAGCDFFAVSCIDEAIAIRNSLASSNCYAEILILGYSLPSQARLLAEYDITQAILSLEFARELSQEAKKANVTVKCHLAIDSGMNRIGICARALDELDSAVEDILQVMALPNLDICGMFSHFSCSDCDRQVTDKQYEIFSALVSKLDSLGKKPPLCHICNSVGAAEYTDYHADGVRLGIMLYGVPESKLYAGRLLPVMRLKTIISHIHKLPAGQHLGYGGEFVSDRDLTIATLPIGYADGYTRAYRGASVRVLTQDGEFDCPIAGRICMDQIMIDITNIPASIGDEVLLFGDLKGEMLASLAKRSNTNEYECMCRISSRVPRIYIE